MDPVTAGLALAQLHLMLKNAKIEIRASTQSYYARVILDIMYNRVAHSFSSLASEQHNIKNAFQQLQKAITTTDAKALAVDHKIPMNDVARTLKAIGSVCDVTLAFIDQQRADALRPTIDSLFAPIPHNAHPSTANVDVTKRPASLPEHVRQLRQEFDQIIRRLHVSGPQSVIRNRFLDLQKNMMALDWNATELFGQVLDALPAEQRPKRVMEEYWWINRQTAGAREQSLKSDSPGIVTQDEPVVGVAELLSEAGVCDEEIADAECMIDGSTNGKDAAINGEYLQTAPKAPKLDLLRALGASPPRKKSKTGSDMAISNTIPEPSKMDGAPPAMIPARPGTVAVADLPTTTAGPSNAVTEPPNTAENSPNLRAPEDPVNIITASSSTTSPASPNKDDAFRLFSSTARLTIERTLVKLAKNSPTSYHQDPSIATLMSELWARMTPTEREPFEKVCEEDQVATRNALLEQAHDVGEMVALVARKKRLAEAMQCKTVMNARSIILHLRAKGVIA